MSEQKKLYKSRKDKLIDGVCGGMAEYFTIDPVIIRIIWGVLVIAGGLGIWAYLIAAVIIPPNPEHKNLPDDQKKMHHPQMIWGAALIIIGSFFLLSNWHFPFVRDWPFYCRNMDWWTIPWRFIGPAALILLGSFYILSVLRHENQPETTRRINGNPEGKRLERPLKNRTIAGVCAAFGNYFSLDPTWIRIVFVLIAVLTHGVPAVLIYISLIFVIPKAPEA